MPTYEFRCSNGHVFDQFHKISDAPSTAECPQCGAIAERAISGGAGLVFKGSGFYLTDYGKNAHRSSGSPAPAKSEGGDGGSKSDAKPESKSESKADAKPSSGTPSTGGASSSSSSSSSSSTGGSKASE